MPKTTSIVMGGVGGQGIVLASKILAPGHSGSSAGAESFRNTRHGPARQRLNLCALRYGGPCALIEQRQADYLFALEKLEAWRLPPYCAQAVRWSAARRKLNRCR